MNSNISWFWGSEFEIVLVIECIFKKVNNSNIDELCFSWLLGGLFLV